GGVGGGEGTGGGARGRNPPPFLEGGRVDAAEIHRGDEVPAVEMVEARRLAVQPPFHASAQREMRVRRAVIGAVRAVLLRAATELRVGDDERRIPPRQLLQGRAQ